MDIKLFDEDEEDKIRKERDEQRLKEITDENWQGKLVLAVEDLASAVDYTNVLDNIDDAIRMNGIDYTNVLDNIDDAIRTGTGTIAEHINDELRNMSERINSLDFTVDSNCSKLIDRVDFVIENIYEEKIEKQYEKDKGSIDTTISWIKHEIENIDNTDDKKRGKIKSIKVLAKGVGATLGIDNTFMAYLLIKRLLIKEGIVVEEGLTNKHERVFVISKIEKEKEI